MSVILERGCAQQPSLSLYPQQRVPENPSVHTPRKRKRNGLEDYGRIGKPFTIHAPSHLKTVKAQKLTPKLLLPRSCLPLAYLDSSNGIEELMDSRLFCAHIEGLENETEKEPKSIQPMVLIAQWDSNGQHYAIEKVQAGVYALCKLASWLTVTALEKLRVNSSSYAPLVKKETSDYNGLSATEWWCAAAVKTDVDFQRNLKKEQEDAQCHLIRLDLKRPLCESRDSRRALHSITAPMVIPEREPFTYSLVQETAQDPEEVLRVIRMQYQDALYASKSSLAYFAKGPLSRARAIFHSSDGSPKDRVHLVQFLRSIVLSLPTTDKKYRETLPTIVQELPFTMLSDDESRSFVAALGEKARKYKKSVVGKNGLHQEEEGNIAKWWLRRDTSGINCDSPEAREEATRTVLLEQRARESQLQIILIMETLALEVSAPLSSTEYGPSNILRDGNQESQNPTKRPKRPQNLNTLLDLLIDRLCIWQSMNVNDEKASNCEHAQASQHEKKANSGSTTSDCLRQFCVDVVLPFYGARLPDLTTQLCLKLGGLKQPSRKRPPLVRALSASRMSIKPGAPLVRQPNRKPRSTLERVLTDEKSASQKTTPSLSRSATDPVLPQMKREVSDTSLSAIPLNRTALQKRYNQREVDLHAASQANEAKLRKKISVEQELQGAIAALKKPNARMAVKEFVEATDRRAAGTHSRKPRNPVWNPLAQGVQVMATPSKNRQKDIFSGIPGLPRASQAAPADLEGNPSSSISRIPSSSVKVGGSSGPMKRRTNHALPAIEQTPTRGPSKLIRRFPSSAAANEPVACISQPESSRLEPILAVYGFDQPSALPPWHSGVQETPSKDRVSNRPTSPGGQNIQATPVNETMAQDTPVRSLPSSHEKGESIYASLGWDDVDELL